MPVRAMAIDPGASTGVAFLLVDNVGQEHIITMTVPSHDGDVSSVVNLLLENTPEVVILERFISRGMLSKYGLETIELVGAIKCLEHLGRMRRSTFFELIRRTPSQRTIYIPRAKRAMDERKKAGVCKSFTDHEVDALAHLLGWMDARSST